VAGTGSLEVFEKLSDEDVRKARLLRNEDDCKLLHILAATQHWAKVASKPVVKPKERKKLLVLGCVGFAAATPIEDYAVKKNGHAVYDALHPCKSEVVFVKEIGKVEFPEVSPEELHAKLGKENVSTGLVEKAGEVAGAVDLEARAALVDQVTPIGEEKPVKASKALAVSKPVVKVASKAAVVDSSALEGEVRAHLLDRIEINLIADLQLLFEDRVSTVEIATDFQNVTAKVMGEVEEATEAIEVTKTTVTLARVVLKEGANTTTFLLALPGFGESLPGLLALVTNIAVSES
jgi:hypothetical protein